MKWVPTPTDWYSDLGLDEAGERAEILHRRAWDWAGHQETDGFIPASIIARLCPTHTKARVAALVQVGKWVKVEGGYQLAEWESVLSDLHSLLHRRKSDAERQRRHRAKAGEPDTEATRDTTTTRSRSQSRDSHGLEENRKNPPNPPASRGDCDPVSQPHPRCRGCGTTKRAQAQQAAAAAEVSAAQEAVRAWEAAREEARSSTWCGECDEDSRWRNGPTGRIRCGCHPQSVLERAARPQLAVVGAR